MPSHALCQCLFCQTHSALAGGLCTHQKVLHLLCLTGACWDACISRANSMCSCVICQRLLCQTLPSHRVSLSPQRTSLCFPEIVRLRLLTPALPVTSLSVPSLSDCALSQNQPDFSEGQCVPSHALSVSIFSVKLTVPSLSVYAPQKGVASHCDML